MMKEWKDYPNSLAGQKMKSEDGLKVVDSSQDRLWWKKLQRAG